MYNRESCFKSCVKPEELFWEKGATNTFPLFHLSLKMWQRKMKRKKNLNVCGLTRNPSRQKFHPQSFDVYNQLLVLFLSYHKYLKPFFKISFTANTCVWAPKDDLRWRLQAFQHHNPAQVSDSIFSMGSWELCVPLLLMFPVTFLKIQAVFSRYFTVRDWSTFCNKWPTNQQFFCQ